MHFEIEIISRLSVSKESFWQTSFGRIKKSKENLLAKMLKNNVLYIFFKYLLSFCVFFFVFY